MALRRFLPSFGFLSGGYFSETEHYCNPSNPKQSYSQYSKRLLQYSSKTLVGYFLDMLLIG